MPRKEDMRLLTGHGTFTHDIVLPGMLHCAFVRSPIAYGRIVSIDLAAARELAGVHAVLTARDLARIPVKLMRFHLVPVELPVAPLAADWVRHVGDPVVLVVAANRFIAEDAASLVEIAYEEHEPVVTIGDARGCPPIHPTTDSNVAAQEGDDRPDEELERLLADAPHLITRTFVHQRVSQSPMEGRGVVAVKQGPSELVVYFGCQSPHSSARSLQIALDMPDMNVRVIAKDVGGSFGLKNHPWREEMAVIVAALLIDRPLKWIEDRLENLTCANQAREQEMTLRVAFDNDGRILGAHGEYHVNNGAYPHGADANGTVMAFMWVAHKITRFGFLCRGWYTNTMGLGAYRGPWAMESLSREVVLDAAARQIGIDPVEIRRRNLVYLPDQPRTCVTGLVAEDVTPGECLEKLLEHFDVAAFRAEQAALRGQGRYLGLGIATYIEPTGTAGLMPVITGEMANIRIEPNGKVSAQMSTFSQGHGTETTMAQAIADELGVPYDDVTVYEGDSSRGGYGPGAAGSRQGVIGGGACIQAARILKDKVRQVAAHLLNAAPEQIDIVNGMVTVAGAEEMTRPLRDIAEIAYGEPMRLPPGTVTGLEAQHRYDPPMMTFTSAAHACVVEVDADTGFVKILRWIASEDCGTLINPAIVEGQMSGGLAQAIGMVLLEHFHYDERGNPTTVTFKDYHLPTIFDIPDFEYIHAGTPSQAEGGFRGVGEGGAIIGPPTLVNAIVDALLPFGDVPLDLPLSPSKLLRVIERGGPRQACAAPARGNRR
jgi:carbon-monoxide dehydrogenase large subunit